jgi:hypothetical protein
LRAVPALPRPVQGGLAIECGVSTIDGLHAVFRQFFPDEKIPPRAEIRLAKLAEDIGAKPG